MSQTHRTIRLAVLISGGGRTLVNLARKIEAGQLNARIVQVITSRGDVPGVQRAAELKVPVTNIERKYHDSVSSFSQEVFQIIRQSNADLVCLAGFLCLLEIPRDFERRVINVHPALLPDFGGKGMYGRRVHEAVIAAGRTQSGCTVHYADATYDTGPTILQSTCEVKPGDTPDTLAARVFEQECIAYPKAIARIAGEVITRVDRRGR